MKRFLIILVALGIALQLTYGQRDPKLSLDPSKAEWFRDAKFGMFIHWGLYSVLEGSYKDRTLPDSTLPNGRSWYAEWIQTRLEIPNEEYQAIKDVFNPIKYDPEQWVLEAKNAGMRYIVITSKHHDGFALWDSDVSDFDIANTPYKKDLLGPLVEACKKHGMKYGFYYSHWLDWEHPDGATPNWTPKKPDEQFEKYWQAKALPQVKELIVKYDPDLLWFDTWGDDDHITPERRDELIALVRENSDKCLINGRICFANPGENIDFLEMHDNAYPNSIMDRPWQSPATMQHSWGYHAKDYNWKSSNEMIGNLLYCTSRGGNYLLNVGPKGDGSLPTQSIRRLREIGAWVYANSEAVYGTKPVQIEVPEGVLLSQKEIDGKQWLYISLAAPLAQLSLPVKGNGKCKVLETGQPIDYENQEESITLNIPEQLFKSSPIPVLKLEIQ